MNASRLVYLHGFRSSPLSFKARMIGDRLRATGLADRFVCPQLPASPRAAMALVLEGIGLRPDDVLVGSSLGGYYATWLAERLGGRAVLLNPAVNPAEGLDRYTGPQTMYHTDEPFDFRPEYLDELRELRVAAISRPERYLLVAATGDELLDWRDMVAHYPDARHRVIQGSDHGISDFEHYLDEVLGFAGFAADDLSP
jgi:predicted esterase YcpF (UPF0227 family)